MHLPKRKNIEIAKSKNISPEELKEIMREYQLEQTDHDQEIADAFVQEIAHKIATGEAKIIELVHDFYPSAYFWSVRSSDFPIFADGSKGLLVRGGSLTENVGYKAMLDAFNRMGIKVVGIKKEPGVSNVREVIIPIGDYKIINIISEP